MKKKQIALDLSLSELSLTGAAASSTNCHARLLVQCQSPKLDLASQAICDVSALIQYPEKRAKLVDTGLISIFVQLLANAVKEEALRPVPLAHEPTFKALTNVLLMLAQTQDSTLLNALRSSDYINLANRYIEMECIPISVRARLACILVFLAQLRNEHDFEQRNRQFGTLQCRDISDDTLLAECRDFLATIQQPLPSTYWYHPFHSMISNDD